MTKRDFIDLYGLRLKQVEVATLLHCSRLTVARMLEDGRLKPSFSNKYDGRRWVDTESLYKFLYERV